MPYGRYIDGRLRGNTLAPSLARTPHEIESTGRHDLFGAHTDRKRQPTHTTSKSVRRKPHPTPTPPTRAVHLAKHTSTNADERSKIFRKISTSIGYCSATFEHSGFMTRDFERRKCKRRHSRLPIATKPPTQHQTIITPPNPSHVRAAIHIHSSKKRTLGFSMF